MANQYTKTVTIFKRVVLGMVCGSLVCSAATSPRKSSWIKRLEKDLMADTVYIGTVAALATTSAVFWHYSGQIKATLLPQNDDTTGKSQPTSKPAVDSTPKDRGFPVSDHFLAVAATVGVTTLFADMARGVMSRIVKRIFLRFVPGLVVDESSRKVLAYHQKLEQIQNRLNDEQFTAIDRMIDQYGFIVETNKMSNNLVNLERRIEDFLSLPVEKKKVTTADMQQFMQLAAKYPAAVKQALSTFGGEILLKSQDRIAHRVTPLLLVGDSGTGKTHLAQEIARSLGLPLFSLSLVDYSRSEAIDGFSDYFGSHYHRGIITDALIHGKGYQNVVVFIDEADRALTNVSRKLNEEKKITSWFAKVTDLDTTSVYSPVMDIFQPIDDLILIVATQSSPQDPSLLKRMHPVQMPAMSDQQKLEIATEKLLKNGIQLSPQVVADLEQLVQADQGHTGFRELQIQLNYYMARIMAQAAIAPE